MVLQILFDLPEFLFGIFVFTLAFGEAFLEFKNALKLDPNYADGHCNLGSSLMNCADVVELVDTTDLKSVASFGMGVQVPPLVPKVFYEK